MDTSYSIGGILDIPKSINISGRIFSIEFVEGLGTDRDSFGEFHDRIQTIKIDTIVHKEYQAAVLLHEIIEAINSNYELELEHPQVSTIHNALYQVLHDNKLQF